MNRIQLDNVHSTIFTPQEYQVELIDSCLKGNTVAVLASRSTRTFLVTMVTRELSYQTRSKELGGLEKRTLIIGKSGPKLVAAGEAIQQNTNLAVATYTSLEQVKGWSDKWERVFLDSQVIVMTSEVLEAGFDTNYLHFENDLNLLVVTDAHLMITSKVLSQVLEKVTKTCRVIGMTSPVLKQPLTPFLLDSLLSYVSLKSGCKINTSSEIVTILRYINKPQEKLIVCASPFGTPRPDLETQVRGLIAHAMGFLEDHRYNPVEVYGPEYAEFCVGVPDPIKEPKQILKEFLTILDNLGLWCADRAALYSLVEIEKLKKKTAYDRHYLLLCVIFSVMARVRAVIEEEFESHSELDQILNFSTPKVLRLIDILRQIRPLNFVDPRKRWKKGESGDNKEEGNSCNKCSSCGCRIELPEGDTNSKVVQQDEKSLKSPLEDDKGCEKLHDEGKDSFSSEGKKQESIDLPQEQSTEDCQNLLNITTECCDLPQTSSQSVSLSGCDVNSSSSSAVYCNGRVSRTESEESDDVDSNPVDTHSVPNADSSRGSESLKRERRNESESLPTPAESTTVISNDTATLPPQVEVSSEIQSTVEATSKQSKEDVPCTCSCHNKNSEDSSLSLPVISIINYCDTSSEGKELNESSPDITEGVCKGLSKGETLLEGSSLPAQSDLEIPNKNSNLKAVLKPEEDEVRDSPSDTPSENDGITNIEGVNSEEVGASSSDSENNLTTEVPVEASKVENEMSSVVAVDEDAFKTGEQDIPPSEDTDKTRKETLVPEGCDKAEVNEVKNNDSNLSNNSEEKIDSNCDNKTRDGSNEEKSTAKAPTSEAIAMADTLAQLLPNAVRTRRRRDEAREKVKVHNPEDPDSVCGLIFVQHRTTARIVYRLLKELSDIGGEFSWIFPQYTVELCKKPSDDPRAAEAEHRKQEEVFRRFRHHECNLLVSTAVLEEGIDIPNCNLVLRFDPAESYTSYVFSRGRAKGLHENFYFHLVVKEEEEKCLDRMASYAAYEQVLLSECRNADKGTDVEVLPDEANTFGEPYTTSTGVSVSMATAISLLNKYCAKLPSDTFTRLTAMWSVKSKKDQSEDYPSEDYPSEDYQLEDYPSEDYQLEDYQLEDYPSEEDSSKEDSSKEDSSKEDSSKEDLSKEDLSEEDPDKDTEYLCTIMLPINSPLKGYIHGSWMPKVSLAKMSAALKCCEKLHQIGELNDNLMPVGKESMQLDAHLCGPLPDDDVAEGMPRPGSTKRRQYYYKKLAACLRGNEPSPSVDLWVYKLEMVLTCPIPDEQNTRGRKIYRPELSARSFGLVTTKPIPQVSGFPVFTRSGEVMVRIREVQSQIRISEDDLKDLEIFHMFTFTHVLRLEKYPIKFHPTNAKSTFFIAPLMQDPESETESIDWDFVALIRAKKDHKPMEPSEEERENFKFKQSLYQDAVVMPWYRNQDQPQYFYVAEICTHLHPQSDFPDAGFESFEKYYLTKYGIQICNLKQPLLDVDHTSGRLNLLTPRHVNRKGVALPTTSEETKKAKRENLQQKQILVPELCTIHPFPASLWRKAVCLPTILYRLNGLLLANELRVRVAIEIGLGLTTLTIGFKWPNLDFGWTLADVLTRSIEASKEGKESLSLKKHSEGDLKSDLLKRVPSKKSDKNDDDEGEEKHRKDSGSDSIKSSEMEIGTWSNDMALNSPMPDDDTNDDDFEVFDPNIELPDNLTMLDGNFGADDDVEGELGADWGTGLPERKARCTVRTEDRGGHEVFRVGSPSNFEADVGWDTFNGGGGTHPPFDEYGHTYNDFYDYCDDFEGFESEPEYEEEEEESKGGEEKEWEEHSKRRAADEKENQSDEEEEAAEWPEECYNCSLSEQGKEFVELINGNKERLRNNDIYLGENEPLIITKAFRQKVLSKTSDNSVQTDEKLLHATPSVLKNGVLEEKLVLADKGEECEKKSAMHADKSTQTDDVAFTHNTEPQILYNVDRENTLKEVKLASVSLPEVQLEENDKGDVFSFDRQPNLEIHAGPSPSIILQALTMSNANDGVNLERLETIGDSYLKYAITNYLYCTYTQKHEGKLSYLRSKQVSNLNLYRLGKRKGLGECMVATKFEPHDNWLPPGYFVPKELEEALIDSGVPAGHWNMADFPGLHDLGSEEIRRLVQERSEQIKQNKAEQLANELIAVANPQDLPIFIPYNLLTQHSIPDKSISDCVEALIGAYLTTCGPRGALLFMSWLGIKVLPSSVVDTPENGKVITYHQLSSPPSPLDACPLPDAKEQLELLLGGYCEFEKKIDYKFGDQSYLLQAFTHASYYRNKLTDCYQRLEFLGDAVLDYLITRHLFEDKRQHSPGSLTDLRSALVNNTIFACLAVKFEFHKYFRHFSPGLDRVVRDFVRMQEENGHRINEEYYFMEEEECEAAEDIEVPKALGDVFESVAGAIFLDSGGSLDAVWKVYYSMMRKEIEQFSGVVPKSPIRELLETEPETAKFGKPERLVDGKVRVSVEIFGKGCFSGVGRNYRIAKSTAAKRALRHLKKLQLLSGTDQGFC